LAQTQLFDPFAVEPEVTTEKEHLLDEMQIVWEPARRLSFTTLIISLLGMLLVCAVLMPKIYLRNAIYYESRDVTKLEHQYAILKQEKSLLKAKVEAIRYKNQVEDTLF
jgi:hypothetical protein